MRFQILAFVWFAALAFAPITLSADNGCCDEPMACCEKPAMTCCQEKPAVMPCCDEKPPAMPSGDQKPAAMTGCDMPCCTGRAAQHAEASEPSAIEMLLAMDLATILAPQSPPAPVPACCAHTDHGAAKW